MLAKVPFSGILVFMRRQNAELLKQLVTDRGGIARVSIGAKIGISTLEKMMADLYVSEPREATRERMCVYFGVTENELFPLVDAGGRAAG